MAEKSTGLVGFASRAKAGQFFDATFVDGLDPAGKRIHSMRFLRAELSKRGLGLEPVRRPGTGAGRKATAWKVKLLEI